jgi:hypothetical protein
MNPAAGARTGAPPVRPAAPSQGGLRLILASTGYLAFICALQLVVSLGTVASGPNTFPDRLMDLRDVVALFGWVGLMITGVSIIIVPNHLGVPLRPLRLPTVHLVLANTGIVGYVAADLVWPGTVVPYAFLALVSGSFLAFAIGVLSTIRPFVGHRSPEPLPVFTELRGSATRP